MELTKVTLVPKLAGEYDLLAKEAGVSLDRIVNDALDKWMEYTGADLYQTLVKGRAWMKVNPGKTFKDYLRHTNRLHNAERRKAKAAAIAA